MSHQALILRDPARAEPTVRALAALGVDARCAQLISAIWPQDTAALHAAAAGLHAGNYDWLVLSSVNTVHVLHTLSGGRPLPAALRVAAVGQSTAQAAERLLGRAASFRPDRQSAAGMIAEWAPDPGSRVLYPHGDLASSTLADGMARWPVEVHEVIAYHTVPTGTAGTPVFTAPAPAQVRVLDPAQIPAALPGLDLVVFAAPSIVRGFAALLGDDPLPETVHTLAIGEPTARALHTAGLPVGVIATVPGAQGVAAAAAQVLGLPPQDGAPDPFRVR